MKKHILYFLVLISMASCKKEVFLDEYEVIVFCNQPGQGNLILKTTSIQDSVIVFNEYTKKFKAKGPIMFDMKLKPMTMKAAFLHLKKNGQLVKWSSVYDFRETAIIKGNF
jgi:hypothetical protein